VEEVQQECVVSRTTCKIPLAMTSSMDHFIQHTMLTPDNIYVIVTVEAAISLVAVGAALGMMFQQHAMYVI